MPSIARRRGVGFVQHSNLPSQSALRLPALPRWGEPEGTIDNRGTSRRRRRCRDVFKLARAAWGALRRPIDGHLQI